MKNTVRSFVAVELSDAVRQKAAELIRLLAASSADVKWVEPHNLHLTLQFLGDVPLADMLQVCEAVRRGAERVEPFEFEVRTTGAFPSTSRPRTVWLGSGRGEQEMVALHDRVEAELVPLGFRKENRRFVPHLTIGRVRRGGPGLRDLAQRLQAESAFEAGTVTIDEAIVFSSRLTPTGPIYEVLGRAAVGRQKQ
jgi:2'-5' RNA ligase